MRRPKIIVVGAGVAGLYCARLLADQGCGVQVWEAADHPGGRVWTDTVDGFQLDRGFQVLQTAYPEAQRALQYDTLHLSPFEPGALIQTVNRQARMADPWRRPTAALPTLFNGIGTFADRLRLARLRSACLRESFVETDEHDCSTQEFLRQRLGFTPDFIDRFLRPWISGMFFDESLETSAQFFRFIFRTLARGDAALPSQGIGAISKQLASRLPEGTIRYRMPVQAIEGKRVVSQTGEEASADAIVLAVDAVQRQRLYPGSTTPTKMMATACFYFASSQSPPVGCNLVLNGEVDAASGIQQGPISNLSVPSNLHPSYAPAGQSLICISVRPSLVGDRDPNHERRWLTEIERDVREQALRWYGSAVESWRLIRSSIIPHAVPRLLPGQWCGNDSADTHDSSTDDVVCCGDYLESPSLQGALVSGRRAAERVLQGI